MGTIVVPFGHWHPELLCIPHHHRVIVRVTVNGTLELVIIPFYMGSPDKIDGFSLMYYLDAFAFAGDIPLGYTCALVNWSWSI